MWSHRTYTREAAAIVFEIFRSITLQENTWTTWNTWKDLENNCRCFSSVCLLTKNKKPVHTEPEALATLEVDSTSFYSSMVLFGCNFAFRTCNACAKARPAHPPRRTRKIFTFQLTHIPACACFFLSQRFYF